MKVFNRRISKNTVDVGTGKKYMLNIYKENSTHTTLSNSIIYLVWRAIKGR